MKPIRELKTKGARWSGAVQAMFARGEGRDTPETDAAIRGSGGQWTFTLKDAMRKLEIERNVLKHEVAVFREELDAQRQTAIDLFIECHELKANAKAQTSPNLTKE